MIKYDLLVYLGLVPVLAAFFFAAYVVYSTPADVDVEVRRMRLADGVLIALAAVFVFVAILYFVDVGGGGKEIFDKSSTTIFAPTGTIIGYIFGAAKK
jgi:cytochrome bd-type quinol oxidase subunit 2